ncbi:MAG: hypothetical protein ACTS5A_02350 [Candidatus Hodgkinia cicadicola]
MNGLSRSFRTTTSVNAITLSLERVRIYNPPKWLRVSKDYPLFEMAERRTLNAPSPYIVRLNMFHRSQARP